MRPTSGAEIRFAFLDFFAERGHLVVPSSSLIPEGDPTLLFTGAGMVQFKPYFSGEAEPPSRRLASAQKCFRTTDIDKVGNERSLTFFEMLGSFSIGDYFKRGAIELAWEFVTECLDLPEDRIWASIYHDDEDAFSLWQEIALPASKIVRLGKEDNFWGPAGETGPCGPCSEIFYDRGAEVGCGRESCLPGCDCARFLEIWNLVFMEYGQDSEGKLVPLPQQNIDTGMGLERTAAAMQDVGSVYETDLFTPIVGRAGELVRRSYGDDETVDRSLRIIAEHGRAITFLVADGVLPSNEGRGYVLRRILRRAVRHGKLLGREDPFLKEIAQVVMDVMGEQYPEVRVRRDFILEVLAQEERAFQYTLTIGSTIVEDLIAGLSSEGTKQIPGRQVFRLYDTYGFPVELTREMAAEKGLVLDEEGFAQAMFEQRERARHAQAFGLAKEGEFYRSLELPETGFLGYETLEATTEVINLARDGQVVDEVTEHDRVAVVLRQTAFYAEAGGQVGDTGTLSNPAGEIAVSDTQSPLPGLTLHYGTVTRGSVRVGDVVVAKVDEARRLDIARNHTATHLLHKALREVLGDHAQQSGSEVAPERLRFDFTHLQALTTDELDAVERLVNAKIRDDLPVVTQVTDYEAAVASGAFAIFGERYGDEVRIVSTGDYTRELCGGTHLRATGQIGFFHVLSEGSIGRGLRRIEAVTGRGAETYVRQQLHLLGRVASQLGGTIADVESNLSALISDLESQRKEALESQRSLARAEVSRVLEEVREVNGVSFVAAEVEATTMETLREMTDWLRDQLGSAVIVLGAVVSGRPGFVAAVTPDLVDKGLKADQLIKEVAAVVGGGGGGRPTLAQAGGKDPERIAEALSLVADLVGRR
ncbi:MAG: alanine--tRNA ligase [Anaerolineae bacterium]|nr:alanine--tRNA ligase [Anaerolineae bacterium]NIN98319.1 alanine--tRNA ligase [Anaerolineae bacterium]NIQ81248.1 alanine--tRNA ligase [Anaerolineae bacterium]